jgi:serine protease Do
VLGTLKEADLALLKVDATNLPTVHLNVERDPQPGELVFAVGSPEGLQNSITMGVISSVWRQPDPDNPMAYLQTDAPINPGNSGGPLVDITGALVGMNTFILSSGGGSEGLGFAIPAPIVNFVYQSLKKYGHVDHVEIGAVAQTITPSLAKGLGLAQDWGVVISDVSPFGPAELAGIKAADVVLTVDGRPMQSLHRFAAALYQHPLDHVLEIDVLRGQEKLSFNVPAVNAADRIDRLAGRVDPVRNHIAALSILGLDFTEDLRSALPPVRTGSGVIVIGRIPGFNSVNTGLLTGDLIHALNRMPINSVEQLKAALAKLKSGDDAVLQIERTRPIPIHRARNGITDDHNTKSCDQYRRR